MSGSFHVYEDELDVANRVNGADTQPISMLPMDHGLRDLDEVFSSERRLRRAALKGDRRTVRNFVLGCARPHTYWTEAMVVFAHTAAERLDMIEEQQTCRALLRPEVIAAIQARRSKRTAVDQSQRQ
jgi:hypothetical protein